MKKNDDVIEKVWKEQNERVVCPYICEQNLK